MTSTAAFREPEPGRTDHGAAEAGPRATEAPLGARPAGVRRIAPPPVPTDGTREALDLLVAALEHRELGAAATAIVAGAVTLEWGDEQAADAALRERCEATLALVGPVLAAIGRAGLGLVRRCRESLTTSLRAALGPRRPVLKLALLAGVALAGVGA